MEKKRIIIALNDWGYAQLIARIIYAVSPEAVIHIVPQRNQAVMQYEDHKYSLVILDCDDYVENAMKFARTIKRKTPTTQICFLAGPNIPSNIMDEFRQLKASIIEKPFRAKEFQHFIENRI